MRVEILLSALEGNVDEILSKLNFSTDVLFVNQTSKNHNYVINKQDYLVRVIETKTRGLARSRNIAFDNANGDILLLCDDDVTFVDNYEEIVLKAFKELPHADIIVFNIDRINTEWHRKAPFTKISRASRFRTYGSVGTAIKKESYLKYNLEFDENFGAGSCYSSGEDSILFRDANRKGLQIYTYPETIAIVDFSESTWRDTEYDKIVMDKGALIARSFPRPYSLFSMYMAYAMRKDGYGILKNYKLVMNGVKKYLRDKK